MSRSPVRVSQGLLVSGPNGGGIGYLREHSVLPLLSESTTGLAVEAMRLAWCPQIDSVANTIAVLEDGRLVHHVLADDDLDLHDLLPTEGGWYAVATAANAVLRVDLQGRVVQRWDFGGDPDAMHLNSVCLHEGRLLVSAFGRFTGHREYKGRSLGSGLVIDVESGETVFEGLSQPHSLVSTEEGLYYCNSESNELVRRDRAGGETRVRFAGYTRGLCVDGQNVYAGLSRSRNLSGEQSIDRFDSAVVAVLRRDDLSVVGYAPLPWNEIYDIRVLGNQDLLQSLVSLALGERDSRILAPTLDEAAQLSARVAQMESQLVSAISNDISRMQDQHGRMLEASVRLQSELVQAQADAKQRSERAERAEALARWTMQVWGNATEQRMAMEALIDAVGSMQGRLVGAITDDITRMQDEHAKAIEAAAVLQGRLVEVVDRAERAEASRDEHARMLSDRNSALAMAQEELVPLRHEAARLREQAATLQQVLRSASWRYTRPLRFLRRLLRHGLRGDDRARMGGLLRRGALALPLPATVRERLKLRQGGGPLPLGALPTDTLPGDRAGVLAPRIDGVADVFVWSVIDWHFRTQRPQHLATALAAKGHRVFYLSNNLIDAPQPGYSLEPLDQEGRLFQVHLNVDGAPSIYFGQPTTEQAAQLKTSLATLLTWTSTCKSISLVQHPFWSEPAQCLPDAQLVYDCMDHHAGFDNNSQGVLEAEAELVERADLVVASSAWLAQELAQQNEKVVLIRNATEYAHFSVRPNKVFRDQKNRRVIGYYGAIAEWFDVELVRRVATDHPAVLVLLIGRDTAGAGERLRDLPNVRFIGEVPYRDLPYWLYGFDVCLLPFLVLPLTVATNPVKIYEYLSAGKPVVAVDLPEMAQFDGLVEVAGDHEAFSRAVLRALETRVDETQCSSRQLFAAGQTWDHRAAEFDLAIARIVEPKVSVVVLTHNNLAFTDACLFSLDAYSDYSNLEIIVVDNASTDGSREYLAEWAKGGDNRELVLNDDNRGFAAGNNQGLEIATGDVLVLLNNDTYVTPGWVRTMLWHLRRDPTVGLVGPVTNNIGNEARIDIGYEDMSGMIRQSSRYTLARPGSAFPLGSVAFFCVMLRRAVYERVGGLDEAFGMGFFEDDDYCRRVAEAGWRVVCAEDVFVHHHLSASFNAMQDEARQELFERNKAIYEAKWGRWAPHTYR